MFQKNIDGNLVVHDSENKSTWKGKFRSAYTTSDNKSWSSNIPNVCNCKHQKQIRWLHGQAMCHFGQIQLS